MWFVKKILLSCKSFSSYNYQCAIKYMLFILNIWKCHNKSKMIVDTFRYLINCYFADISINLDWFRYVIKKCILYLLDKYLFKNMFTSE